MAMSLMLKIALFKMVEPREKFEIFWDESGGENSTVKSLVIFVMLAVWVY